MEVEQVNKPGITSGGNWPDISPCRLESPYRRHAYKPLKFILYVGPFLYLPVWSGENVCSYIAIVVNFAYSRGFLLASPY